MKYLATVLVTLLALSACSSAESSPTKPGDPPDPIAKIHENAPAWARAYSDDEIRDQIERVCDLDSQILEEEALAKDIPTDQWGYVVGIAQAQC